MARVSCLLVLLLIPARASFADDPPLDSAGNATAAQTADPTDQAVEQPAGTSEAEGEPAESESDNAPANNDPPAEPQPAADSQALQRAEELRPVAEAAEPASVDQFDACFLAKEVDGPLQIPLLVVEVCEHA